MALLRRRASAPAMVADEPVERAPRAPEALLATLRSGATRAERREAALDLTAMPETAGALAAALDEEDDPSVRDAIVTALIAIGTGTAAAGLAGLLRSKDAALRNAAIEALQQMGEAAGEHVERLLASPDPDLRIFAVNVIEVLRHASAGVWLRQVLEEDPEVNVGLAAVEVLTQLGGPEDVPVLRAFAGRFPNEPFVDFAVDLACRRAIAAGAA
ncbi:HEAT repeat domain-containing protein [Roseicella aquatilis]|uniref:HEAT repeat domain-containing protein n=1 Tax=Roseicella aquatilis TaxID=2527868 RepID=A0A4R4DT64_9PROT|nr:HEAT repeat domain-containing protein [Roseicella aquatilis]TCZ64996.1 HEAT repeat domain-containing protein [Roseicella aquatilis]